MVAGRLARGQAGHARPSLMSALPDSATLAWLSCAGGTAAPALGPLRMPGMPDEDAVAVRRAE